MNYEYGIWTIFHCFAITVRIENLCSETPLLKPLERKI